MTKLKDILDTYDNTLAIASQISETSVVTRRKAFEKCRLQFESAINEYIAEIINTKVTLTVNEITLPKDIAQEVTTNLRAEQRKRAGITGSGKV